MANPPDKAYILQLIRRITDPGWYNPIADDEGSYSILRMIARAFEAVATSSTRNIQGKYYLPHSLQVDPPSSSWVKAAMDVRLKREEYTSVQVPIVAEQGWMTIVGPGGREYVNSERIVFDAREIGTEKTAVFECKVPGYVGNLDFLDDGTGYIPSDRLTIPSLSNKRGNNAATILHVNGQAVIQDDGSPDTFGASDVGLMVKIVGSTSTQNQDRILRIIGYTPNPIGEYPSGSGLTPSWITVDESTRWYIHEAYSEDISGPTRVDETVDCNDTDIGDVALLPATIGQNDSFVIMSREEIVGLDITISQLGSGSWTILWEGYTGTTWVPLSLVKDDTFGFKRNGSVTWPKSNISYGPFTSPVSSTQWSYAVRGRVTDTTPTMSVQPLATRIVPTVIRPIANETATVAWRIHDYRDSSLQIVSVTAPSNGRDDDLYLLGDDRGVYQQPGETDESFRLRASRLEDAVSPGAILRAVNRILAPYGREGKAIDVQNGFIGLFVDTDAADYYSPGDVYPEDPYKLPLSSQEAYGFFFIVVPVMGVGEFGIFADNGPVLFIEGESEYVGPAADSGFVDGYPIYDFVAYRSIYDTVRRIKSGGVDFTLIKEPT